MESADRRVDAASALSLPAWFWALLCVLGALPLLYPAIPPLTDVPGHIGHYAVQVGLAGSPELQRFYGFQWVLIPNLGVDLLVQMLAPLIGVEPAVKLIAICIPMLQIAGFLAVARQAHGHVPATALFALPLAWSYPLQFGFLNFSLSVGLAMLAFALWLRMAERPAARAGLFLIVACPLWVVHIFGWSILMVLCASHLWTRQRAAGLRILPALARTAQFCAPLALPQVLRMILPLPGGGVGETLGFFSVSRKLGWLVMALRDRWMAWDIATLLLLVGLILWGMVSPRFERHRGLALAGGLFALLFVLLPTQLIGSYYADMRLVPVMLAVALLALRPGPRVAPALARRLAMAATLLFVARILATTASLFLYDRAYARELDALAHLPRGAALVTLVSTPCARDQGWRWDRKNHLSGVAVSRAHAFSNDQWTDPGGHLLRVEFPGAAPFDHDPSQRVTETECDTDVHSLPRTLAAIPPAFRYLWIVDPARYQHPAGWSPVWRAGTSGLYRR